MGDVARVHYVIPDDLHRRVKAAAALEGVTLKEWLIRALEHELERRARDQARDQ